MLTSKESRTDPEIISS